MLGAGPLQGTQWTEDFAATAPPLRTSECPPEAGVWCSPSPRLGAATLVRLLAPMSHFLWLRGNSAPPCGPFLEAPKSPQLYCHLPLSHRLVHSLSVDSPTSKPGRL